MSLLLAALLLQAPAADPCSRKEIGRQFNNGAFDVVERTAKLCAKSDPFFHFIAAQAQGERRRWQAQKKSLTSFLAAAASGDPNRAAARTMLDNCEKELARIAEAKKKRPDEPRPPKDPGPAPPPGETQPVPSGGETTTPSDTRTPNGDDPTRTPPTIDAPEPEKAETPVDPEVDAKPTNSPRRRLWFGVGILAGTSALASVTTGLAGYLGSTRPARRDNDAALAEFAVPADFDPTPCHPFCTDAKQVESKYGSEDYYRRLVAGLTRESAGVALGTASLGLVLGTLPEVAKTPRRRRIGLGAMIVSGAAMLAGGAAMMNHFNGSVRHSLSGFDPLLNPDGWRAGAYDEPRRNYLLSAALTGLGVGLVIGGATTAALRWRDESGGRGDRARLRVTPTFTGLLISGSF